MSEEGRPRVQGLTEAEYAQIRAFADRIYRELVPIVESAHRQVKDAGLPLLVGFYACLSALVWMLAIAATGIAHLERPEAVAPDAIRLDHFHKSLVGFALDLLEHDAPWPKRGGQA